MERTFFLHVENDSPLVNLHPALKILALVAVNLEAWIIESPLALLTLLLALIALFRALRVPLSRVGRFLAFAAFVVQAIMFSYILGSAIPGRVVLLRLPWGTYVSDMTVLYAAAMVLRFMAMLVGSTLILAVMRDVDVVYGLKSLGVPFTASFTVSLALRAASMFLEDYFKVRDAMVLRGTDFSSGSVFERARKYARLAVPLMVLGVRRMLELSYVLEVKGVGLRRRRTYIHQFQLGWRGYVVAAALVLAPILSLVAKLWLGVLTFPGWPLR